MKQNQSYPDYNDKMVAFEQHFKLGEMSYELERYKATLPFFILDEAETMLIDMYLRVILEEKEIDKDILNEFKGKISA